MYCHSLYILEFYQETVALPASLDMAVMKYFISSYGAFLFFYSQALGECSRYEEAHIAAIQAYAVNTLTERLHDASALKRYLHDDFALEIDY